MDEDRRHLLLCSRSRLHLREDSLLQGRDLKKTVDKPCVPSYDKNSKKTKVVRKKSTHKLFAEREVHRLKDIPEKDMWKVAFEPEC